MQMALYPLAVPYLLNPAGIAVLVTVSDQLDSVLMFALVAGLVLLMGVIDMAVFKNLDKLAKQLDPSRLMVTEAVFGVLLAALAVQLVLDGLETLGIISGLPGH
jgi:multiple antibiotic resistance protein